MFRSRWRASSLLPKRRRPRPNAPALDKMPPPALELDAMRSAIPLLRNAL